MKAVFLHKLFLSIIDSLSINLLYFNLAQIISNPSIAKWFIGLWTNPMSSLSSFWPFENFIVWITSFRPNENLRLLRETGISCSSVILQWLDYWNSFMDLFNLMDLQWDNISEILIIIFITFHSAQNRRWFFKVFHRQLTLVHRITPLG